jgi:Tfp pilus assembly protein PilN
MKRIRIDFAPRSARRAAARTRVLTWLLGALSLTLCISAGMTAFELLQRQRAAQADLQRLRADLAKRTARKPVPKKFTIGDAQALAVNSAIAQLNLPWRDVLDAMEAATPPTIALLALEPDAKKRVLKGVAEAKSSDGMIAYIKQLKQQTFFGAVVLTRHEINEQDPNKPLRFQFEALWTETGQ